MTQELISVVVPAHNSELYIAENLHSILAQTYENLEIIVVDDGSTDNTKKVVLEQDDARIRYIYQDNAGSGAARNLGINSANGTRVAFLDSDDMWMPQKLELQMRQCDQFHWSQTDAFFLGEVYEKNTLVSSLTEKFSGLVMEELLQENFVVTSCVIAKREILLEAGGFKTSLRALQDWDLWLRLAAQYPLGYCNQPLTYYRIHADSVSRSARKTLPYHLELIENTYSETGVAYRYRALKSDSLANSYNICSQISEQEGDLAFSFYCALHSLRYRPSELYKWTRIVKLSVKILLFSPIKRLSRVWSRLTSSDSGSFDGG